jgi:hypothetical protein
MAETDTLGQIRRRQPFLTHEQRELVMAVTRGAQQGYLSDIELP